MRTNLVLINQEDHRFQYGGDEEEREDNHEQQLNILNGMILLSSLTNGLTKKIMSRNYLVFWIKLLIM